MTVIKVKIQKEFTVLHNAVLENPRLSFKAKGLWAYCMSRPDDWEFHVSHLASVCKEKTDAIYSAIKELIAEGLIEKVQKNERGRFGAIDYIIYPYPLGLKKCLPHAGFPDAGFPDAGNPALLSTDIYKERTSTSYVGSEPPTSDSPPNETKSKEKKSLPIDAWDIAQDLLRRIVAVFPKHKPPSSLESWAKDLDIMNRRDFRDWDEMRKVIAFAFEDAFWVKVIQAPDSLRRNYDKIVAKMTPVNNSGQRYEKNRAIAQEAKAAIKNNVEKWKNFYIASNEVVRLDTKETIALDLDVKIFESRLLEVFRLTKD